MNKEEKKVKMEWKKMMTRIKNLEFLGGHFYDSYVQECLTIFFYDKKKKKVFAGTLSPSSYSKKEILSREYALKFKKKKTSENIGNQQLKGGNDNEK